MNWLMYIGGGLLWIITWHGFMFNILNVTYGRDENINGKCENVAQVFFASLFAWIWLCWRFIR